MPVPTLLFAKQSDKSQGWPPAGREQWQGRQTREQKWQVGGPKAAGAQPSAEDNPALPHPMPPSSPFPTGLGVMQHPAKNTSCELQLPRLLCLPGNSSPEDSGGPQGSTATLLCHMNSWGQGPSGAVWGSLGFPWHLLTGKGGTQHSNMLQLRTQRALSLPWDRILHPLCSEQGEGVPP